LKNKKREHETGRIVLNYCPPLTDRIRKVSKKYGIGSYYTFTRGTLRDQLLNLKDKREDAIKSGIYEIKCGTYRRKYKGQSRRKVTYRWDEHDIEPPQTISQTIAAHCLELNHEMGEKKLFREVTDPKNLNAWESLLIHQLGPVNWTT
jgi:hypothetical protein